MGGHCFRFCTFSPEPIITPSEWYSAVVVLFGSNTRNKVINGKVFIISATSAPHIEIYHLHPEQNRGLPWFCVVLSPDLCVYSEGPPLCLSVAVPVAAAASQGLD